MNSRTLVNIGLLVLLIGLGLVTYFEPGLEPPPPPETLSSMDRDNITQIHIAAGQRRPIQLERRQDHWYVLGQQPIPAGEFQVHALLDLLGAKAKRSYSLDELQPGNLGLDPPSATVRFDDVLSVEFGDTEPLEGNRYVRAGDNIFLIEDRFQHLIQTDLTTYVNHRLLPGDAPITHLQLDRVTLARSDATHWLMTPEDPEVSADAIQELVDAWQQATALWVREYHGDIADSQMEIQLEGAHEPAVFLVLAREPELVLARPEWGIQYHLPEDTAWSLFNFTKLAPEIDDAAEGEDTEADDEHP